MIPTAKKTGRRRKTAAAACSVLYTTLDGISAVSGLLFHGCISIQPLGIQRYAWTSTELRLLIVTPGGFYDAVHCTLIHSRINDVNVPFEVISYTWANEAGDATKTKKIFLAGWPFSVTANCEAALKRVRRPTSSRVVWIDAVCINQDDRNERGHQVRLMPEIYSGARRVLIYLGEPRRGGARRLEQLMLPAAALAPQQMSSTIKAVQSPRTHFSRGVDLAGDRSGEGARSPLRRLCGEMGPSSKQHPSLVTKSAYDRLTQAPGPATASRTP